VSSGANGPEDRRSAEQDLLAEIGNLTSLVAAQERAVAESFEEMRRAHASLGWRAQRRFEKVGRRMLGNRMLREPYRFVRRAFEIWVDHGPAFVFTFAARKIGSALRGRPLTVDDHIWTPNPDDYQTWIDRNSRDAAAYAAMRAEQQRLPERPLVSVMIESCGAGEESLRRTIDSLRAQIYERWEVSGTLQTANGSVVVFVNAGDELAPEALFSVVRRFNAEPAADIVYSDHDVIDSAGRRVEPFFKPEWDPELLLATNYLGPFTAIRRTLADDVGGLRDEFGAGRVYDLTLRACEHTTRIAHVPEVLCHLRPRAMTRDGIIAHHTATRDEKRAIEDALSRRRRQGGAEPIFTTRGSRCYATRFRLTARPLVSIIIPTRNQVELLRATIDSIVQRTEYGPYEIVVVDNGSTDAAARTYLASLTAPVHVHPWPHAFNYSAINNFAVRMAKGQQLLFLNNDVEVIRPDWLTALLEYSQFPGVGAVGAKLLYSDGTIQHAGVVLKRTGVAHHAFRWAPREVLGVPRLADLPRNCSAVTGACMLVPRGIFEEAGGFDEELRVVLNDIDLCLRIRERGYAVIYTPHAQLYHHEGSSRGRLHPPSDDERFVKRWAARFSQVDPYYNPNLTDVREDWTVRLETESASPVP
jgi:GT2 family glycosyltransferase